MPYRVVIPKSVEKKIDKLRAGVQTAVYSHLQMLGRKPKSGKALQGVLWGYNSSAEGNKFRVVYELDEVKREVRIMTVAIMS